MIEEKFDDIIRNIDKEMEKVGEPCCSDCEDCEKICEIDTGPCDCVERALPPKLEEKKSSRHQFFVRRLKEMGLHDADSDYSGMIGRAVEELSEVFSKQRHSGMSAAITLGVFSSLMDEWNI